MKITLIYLQRLTGRKATYLLTYRNENVSLQYCLYSAGCERRNGQTVIKSLNGNGAVLSILQCMCVCLICERRWRGRRKKSSQILCSKTGPSSVCIIMTGVSKTKQKGKRRCLGTGIRSTVPCTIAGCEWVWRYDRWV